MEKKMLRQRTNTTSLFLAATAALGIGTNIVVAATLYDKQKELDQEYCDPSAHKIFPQECLTSRFFENLNTYVYQGNYEAAVDSFLNPKEREYATTLGTNYDAEEHLVRRFGLKPFLGGVELCGTPETPSCEELIIDPSCGCPKWDYGNSKKIIDRVYDIKVQKGTDSIEGKVEVRFDEPMRYIVIDGDKAIVKQLAVQEPYLTTFTPHWDYFPKTK